MPHEPARLQYLQGAGTIPGSLALGVEHNVVFVRADAAGATDSTADGDGLSVRCDFDAPSAKGGI